MTKDDEKLFRRQMGDVRRIETDKVRLTDERPRAIARFRRRDEREALSESLTGEFDHADLETGDELIFRRPGVQQTDYRRLRRGRYSVGDEIDLHGLAADAARDILMRFLHRAVSRGIRCVRVVHGKGLRSGPAGPVIKKRIGRWLRNRDEVLAFCSARPIDGGTGAAYVLLRRRKS